MDEITRSLKEVEKLFGDLGARPKQTHHHHHHNTTSNNDQVANKSAIRQLLTVQHKNLNPSYEMKRMFGSRVVQSEQ